MSTTLTDPEAITAETVLVIEDYAYADRVIEMTAAEAADWVESHRHGAYRSYDDDYSMLVLAHREAVDLARRLREGDPAVIGYHDAFLALDIRRA